MSTENLSTEELCSACASLSEELDADTAARLAVAAEEGDIASVEWIAKNVLRAAQLILNECAAIEKYIEHQQANRQLRLV